MKLEQIQHKLDALKLRHRLSQLEMIAEVYRTLDNDKIITIEAPTGTGKTLSYLTASYYAKKNSQKVVICTATIALQEQLMEQDLPLLERLCEEKFRSALAKGRTNYLCLAKLYDNEQTDMFDDNDTTEHLKNQVESHFWNGDKEKLSEYVSEKSWRNYTTDSVGCSGKSCEYFDKCYFFKARAKMHTADFIVTNHSLLMADLELGGGVLLPEPKDNIYIIDECHHLPHRAIDHFSKSAAILSAIEWINQIGFSVQRAISNDHIGAHWQSKVNQTTMRLVEQIKQLKTQLDNNANQFDENIWRIKENEVDSFEIIKHLLGHSKELLSYCNEIHNTLELELELKKPNKDDETFLELSRLHTQFKFLLSRAADFTLTWQLFFHVRKEKEAPIARWFEKIISRSTQSEDYQCHCSPINISQQLKALFWDKVVNGAVLCSATVRSLGSFDNFSKKTGLNLLDHASCKSMPAIFNYPDSIIFVPTMQSEPTGMKQAEHRREALKLLPQLIAMQPGTLVLFTSRVAMNETFDALADDITIDILVQGTQSKTKLIATHKKNIDAKQRSILFGLASFAEGIDLPANYCQHVIIHKLPFAVPSTPIELTRSEWISQHNLNPFMLATLPETSIKLTQYIGRLIRQEDDRGIVTILDRRLYSKSYGKKLLDNTPPFTKLINKDIKELHRVWQNRQVVEV